MNEQSDRATPDDWPVDLPAPASPDLPAAAVRWLWEVLPADRWRHPVLRREPWTLALMAPATIEDQIEGLRTSYRRTLEVYKGSLEPQTLTRLVEAHGAEASRLAALQVQARLVEEELFRGGARRLP